MQHLQKNGMPVSPFISREVIGADAQELRTASQPLAESRNHELPKKKRCPPFGEHLFFVWGVEKTYDFGFAPACVLPLCFLL